MTKAAELAKMGEVLTNSQLGGRRNVIINGAMQVAQRSDGVTGLGASGGIFTCDRMMIDFTTSGRLTQSQATITDLPGFANALKLDCTTADTSIAADEYTHLQYRIEGQDLQQFKKGTSDAEKMTISFYVKGNGNATYICELYDGDNGRQISQTFSVTSSWNRVVLTYDGDTTGAFDDDNNLSLYILIWLHSGSNYNSGTLSTTWTAQTTANRAVGGSSFFSSTDNQFFITGLQMEVGSQATPFEHRSFGEELALCERYFVECFSGDSNYESAVSGWAFASNGTVAYRPFRVQMRARPTLSKSDSGTIHVSDDVNSSINVTNITTSTSNTSRDFMYMECASSGLTQYRPYHVRANGTTTNASIQLDAEL
jgi:hypothetical protein